MVSKIEVIKDKNRYAVIITSSSSYKIKYSFTKENYKQILNSLDSIIGLNWVVKDVYFTDCYKYNC